MKQRRSLSDDSSRGFTLVEMLIATAVLVVIGGGVFTLLNQSQRSYGSQQDMTEVVQQARLAMDQITTYLRRAGNDPQKIFETWGIPPTIPFGHGTGPGSHTGIFPIEVNSAQHIQIHSDVTGAVGVGSTASGDPDGTIDNLYEKVVVRYDSVTRKLYMDIADGSGEQLYADNISSFAFTFYDLAGTLITNPANNEAAITRAHVQLTAETKDLDPESGKVQTLTLESDVMLRSKSYSPF